MATIVLDPSDSDIIKANRDPSAPATSPSKSVDAAAGNEDIRPEAFDAAPALSAVGGLTWHAFINVTSATPGLGYVNLSLLTASDVQIGATVQLSVTGGFAWESGSVTPSDLAGALGHAPTESDISGLKLKIQADAFDGSTNSTGIYSAAYLELDYTVAGGGGPTNAQRGTGFFAFP